MLETAWPFCCRLCINSHMAIDFELLQDSPHLLDILVQMEDVLDSMDVYVFKNWLKGEVAEGPVVRRYWLDMTLRYKADEMPDPRADLRLLKHGVRVDFEKAKYDANDGQIAESEEADVGEGEEDNSNAVWLVRISIPRRLVVQMNDAQHDFYDEEVDIDQVEDAKDDGLDDESAYKDDENDIDGTGADPMDTPAEDPNQPQPGAPQ
jgi:hypothetical protein